jgi:plastocyanin
MRTGWLRAVGLFLAATLSIAACGGGNDDGSAGPTAGTGPTGPVEATLDVEASEFAFEPDALSASADTVTAIQVTNVGSIEHDLRIDEGDLTIVADRGETAEGTFSLPAGTYAFYCSIPGHREAGMEGVLTVS